MLTFVCWKWTPPAGYRTKFLPEHVHTLYSMLGRHYTKPFKLICVTDDWRGLSKDIEVVPIWEMKGNPQSPHGGMSPNCYRRLRAFAPEAKQWFGDRFVSIDLDVVITDLIDPLFDRKDQFVIWEGTAKGSIYNGTMFMLETGTRPQVWNSFDPVESPRLTLAAGMRGSDQAWIQYCLPGEATWTAADDYVYSYHRHIIRTDGRMPRRARIVSFAGNQDPWDPDIQRTYEWVRNNYR